MKLDKDPRIVAGAGFMAALLDILRKIARAVNGLDDERIAQAQRLADLEQRVSDLEGP